MDNQDMSEMVKNLSSMLNGANIPDNVMDMLNNFKNSSNSTNDTVSTDSKTSTSTENSGIDMETLMKISSIISKMNSSQNDPRANLLLSLKPYLKESRQSKVEQYVKLLNMSKVLEVINPNGSEKVK